MKKRETKGMISISIGYLIWGLLPLYWNLINYVSALEILLHRVLWSLVLCILYFVLIKKNAFSLIKKTLQTKHIALLFLSATLLFLNWLSYIYAVTSNHLLQASMGYFISPLLIVFFALVLFKEKMGRLQVIALLVCALGVVYTTVQVGVVPYLSLAIGLTFSSYTICKKYINLDGIQSLLIDTVLITPIVIGMMIYMGIKGTSSFLNISVTTDLLLIGGGLATFIPLSLYINGTITIPAKSVGFLQFITPIMAFFLGIFTYKESFETHDAITFSLILTGVILYLLSLRRRGVSKKVSMRKE